MARRRMFANMLNGQGNFVSKTAGAAVAAAAIDGASEYFRIPILNDESNLNMFQGHSNAEVILYGAGVLGTVLSLFATLSKQRLVGNVGSDLLGPSLGAIVGTYSWENFIAPSFIRNNPAPLA